MFVKMPRSVFREPMSFFDSTPAGRILNRVSIDRSVVDLYIPFRLENLSMQKIGNFELHVQCLTNVEENPFELTGQVTL